jgi:hypothetical protein
MGRSRCDSLRVALDGRLGGRWVLPISSLGPGSGPLWPVSGRLTLCRHLVRVTARARISQFAEANSMCRWLRFLAIPR